MDIIQIKLKRDLLKMSLEYSVDLDIDKKEFTEWINKRIEHYINEKKMSFDPLLIKSNHPLETRCTARLYANRTGKDQCTHKRIKESTYCQKHLLMLKHQGVLRFGDISEEIPHYDLIKQKQGIIEQIYWEDSDPLQQLQQILNQQKRKVILSTPKLVLF